MSITPFDPTILPGTIYVPRSEPAARATTGAFADQLAASGRNQEADPAATAATAAEILRLEMMKSAISLGTTEGEGTAASFGTRALQDIMAAFRNNAPATTEGETLSPQATAGGAAPAISSAPHDIDELIRKASRRYGVDGGLIKAVVKAESNFNPRAVSSAGAQGLMQLMPQTARGLGVTDSFDPEQNVMAGTRFLKDMLKRYGGNVDAALAAYNWGPGNVDRRGDSLPRETREYLTKVKAYYSEFS